ncbi:MAG: mannose-6-phosphate isomerase [Nanoarchaeota archaeon]|nr:mannose-6-phosphate isomerase [Nanoarchaeota archaeon]
MKEVKRPWGEEKHFIKNKKCTVKVLSVSPGQRLSLQKHAYRVERWYFLTDGYAQLGKKVLKFKKGDFVSVDKGKAHRLVAKGKRVDVLEISEGKFLQSDEVRLEDDYGRS